jgi:hypothetical protein
MTITDIVNKIYFLTNTNNSNFSASNMLIEINNAYDRVASLIMEADGRWEWDDDNQTDLPVATTTLVDGQQDYTFATSHLSVDRVSVLDSDGNYQELTPISLEDIPGDPAEYYKTDGLPTQYDKRGASIFLYPAPDATKVTTALGLKVFFQRGPALYTSAEVTAGTKVPGFNSLYHDLIAYWVAYNYGVAKGLPNTNQFFVEIDRKEKMLRKDYAFRNKDERKIMTPKQSLYI